jgi:transcriptional regulator with XRE-family HTH domain
MSEYEIELYKIIGEMIREIRVSKNLTLDQVADKIGVIPKTIQRYETGERKIKINTLNELSDILGFDYYVFMEEAKHRLVVNHVDTHKLESSQKERVSIYKDKVEELKLKELYNKLSLENRHKLLTYATGLYQIQESEDHILNAAHERPGATSEEKSHDDAIMDDENF